MGQPITTVRANVKAWECDVMEHMNVQHYLAHRRSRRSVPIPDDLRARAEPFIQRF